MHSWLVESERTIFIVPAAHQTLKIPWQPDDCIVSYFEPNKMKTKMNDSMAWSSSAYFSVSLFYTIIVIIASSYSGENTSIRVSHVVFKLQQQ